MSAVDEKIAEILETFVVEAGVDDDLVSLSLINDVATIKVSTPLEILDIDTFAEGLQRVKSDLLDLDEVNKVRMVVVNG